MSRKRDLVPLKEANKIYARPGGSCYHLKRDCYMLQGGDFERLNYKEVPASEINRCRLLPCACVYRKEQP